MPGFETSATKATTEVWKSTVTEELKDRLTT